MAKKVEKNKIKEKVKEKPKPQNKFASKVSKCTSEPCKPVAKTKKSTASQPIRNVIVSYSKIENELKLELIKKYPDGYANYVKRYPKPNGESFFAIPLEVKGMNYLIKVEVKVDNLITEDEFDRHFGDISEVDNKAINEVEVDNTDDDDDDLDEQTGDDDDDLDEETDDDDDDE